MGTRVVLCVALLAVLACCTAHADVSADINVSKKLGLSLSKGEATAAVAEEVVVAKETPAQAVLSVPQVSIDVDLKKEKVPLVTMADAPCKNVCKDKCSTHLEKHCLNVTIPKKHCSIEKKIINKEFCQKKCKPTLTVNLPEFKLPSFKNNPNPSSPPADVSPPTNEPTPTPEPETDMPQPPTQEPEAPEVDEPETPEVDEPEGDMPNPSTPPEFMPNPSAPPEFMPNPSAPPTFANPSAPPASIAKEMEAEVEEGPSEQGDYDGVDSEAEDGAAQGRRLQGLAAMARHPVTTAVVHGAIHKAAAAAVHGAVHGAIHKVEKPALNVQCKDVCVTIPFEIPELVCKEDTEVVEKCTVVPDMTCEKECVCIPQKTFSLNLSNKSTVSVNVNKEAKAEVSA